MSSVAPSELAPMAHPNGRFLLSHPAHFIALGFGSGLARVAPGTFGTLWAWAAYVVLQQWLNPLGMGLLIAASLPLGWWACTVTAQDMRVADSGHIVWDEVVAFWIVLWLVMPVGWMGQLAAFVLFRVFDMVKIGPVAWADAKFHGFGWRGGFGIMLDDLVAALCALLVIAAWKFW